MASIEILPYDISEKILSFLNLKHRATTCLVSRNWHHMIKSLDDHKFVQTNTVDTAIYTISHLVETAIPKTLSSSSNLLQTTLV
ncbi:hypothetical protein H5410_025797 [Solanum commersonii]|uniref:F-box domain-containing protein n=1 Tax=Solanum commersonii TaxID=4109 RepID=A0A9J5YUR7_SOLCO|nr:hypothetical protein H5410_025797 [Solanum commersonii]